MTHSPEDTAALVERLRSNTVCECRSCLILAKREAADALSAASRALEAVMAERDEWMQAAQVEASQHRHERAAHAETRGDYASACQEIERLRTALSRIKAIRAEPAAEGFVTGPLAHFQAAQRIARAALGSTDQ